MEEKKPQTKINSHQHIEMNSSERVAQTHPGHQYSKIDLDRLRLLEGDCKVASAEYLQINYIKGLFLGIMLSITVIGLLFLKHYVSLRAFIFYSKSRREQATHVYICSLEQDEQICSIQSQQLQNTTTRFFTYRKLKYQILSKTEVPLGLDYPRLLPKYLQNAFISQGLTPSQAKEHETYFGRNQHKVEVPHYFEYLFDVMTKPFFIFQYIVSVMYILEKVTTFGILMIVFGWLTTTINYILLRRSYAKIKQTAEREFPVKVLRGGAFQQIRNIDLVPGDIYEPSVEIPCDSIILNGSIFVNEANLTGENRPIAKIKLTQIQKVQEQTHWIFQGSKMEITTKQGILAVAVNVGFATHRGRIIRKILSRQLRMPQFYTKLIYFLSEVLLCTIIVYVATLGYLKDRNISTTIVVFRFLEYVAYSFPAPFPIFFNLIYSFCLQRLNRDGILSTEPEKTVEGARLKTICFDKTGTLTKNEVEISNVYYFKSESQKSDITLSINDQPLISALFGCCNSVDTSSGVAKGDEIDVAMFENIKARIADSKDSTYLRQIIVGNASYKLLVLNQYQSKFASMSVLVSVEQRGDKRYYIFAKGSPEKIQQNSLTKHAGFDAFLRRISLEEGYRTIGYSYREVDAREVDRLKNADRQDFLKNTKMLGLVCFVNSLKSDAKQTITNLTQNDISTKIITGDNIFLGIKTAMLTGMIPSSAVVLAVEGSKINENSGEILRLMRNEAGNLQQTKIPVQKLVFKNQPNLYYAIDNDFIKTHPNDFLHPKVKVFARISPQNKALIIKQHKKIYREEISNRPFFQRHFGECSLRVGMVGDGANDLIAIKEADVGIGIAGADAVFSAAFAVQELAQVEVIIKQAKNAQRQVIETVQFFGVEQLLVLVRVIILTEDSTLHSSNMVLYTNFATAITSTVFYGLSRCAQKMTKYFTTSNFMGLQHQLVYWGNTLIFAAGYIAVYRFYVKSDDFTPNPNPEVQKSWNMQTKSATIMFLASQYGFIFLAFITYRSSPWKEAFYKNCPLMVLFVANIILIYPMYFLTGSLRSTSLLEIGRKEAGIVLAIMSGVVIIVFIYNLIIEKLAFHQRIHNQSIQKYEEVQRSLDIK